MTPEEEEQIPGMPIPAPGVRSDKVTWDTFGDETCMTVFDMAYVVHHPVYGPMIALDCRGVTPAQLDAVGQDAVDFMAYESPDDCPATSRIIVQPLGAIGLIRSLAAAINDVGGPVVGRTEVNVVDVMLPDDLSGLDDYPKADDS